MSKKLIALIVVSLLTLVLLSEAAFAGQPQAPPRIPTPTPAEYEPLDHDPSVAMETREVVASPLTMRPAIADLVARVDGDRWHADVTTLAQFGAAAPGDWGTRRTLSAGNLAARDWISATLADAGWPAYFHPFFMVGGMSYNVVGERTGHATPDDVYIVGAHMDSTSPDPWNLAPGAEDNASGTAALLEIARVLQERTPASTIRLVAFSGEEQGLLGSYAYVSYLSDVTRDLDRVKGVYILDMIGYTSHPDNHGVVLQTRDPNTYPWVGDIRDQLAAAAATYTSLDVFSSNTPLGSDHLPFLSRQVPAVLMIEAEFGSYPYYHTTSDLPDHVVPAQGQEVIKMVVAALADRPGVLCVIADLDCDEDVDSIDLAELATHWGFSLGEAGFDNRSDLNHDGTVNIIDLQMAAAGFTR